MCVFTGTKLYRIKVSVGHNANFQILRQETEDLAVYAPKLTGDHVLYIQLLRIG